MNVVIQSVLPVQQSLPPQKEKGLEVQSKNEDSSFDRTMRMENKKQPQTEKTKREEAPTEEKKIIFFLKIGNERRTKCKERRKKRDRTVVISCI
ncbi:hypothetical protein bthur0004_15780 [Bacillus thuringiensis serovar sotto str. T04001]|nr:hypothetical protein bthur0004_15780 [Bacillus thuringiensis serovar sotto str. T04001]